MRKRVSRLISASVALCLSMGLALIPASAAETTPAEGEAEGFSAELSLGGANFSLTGDALEVGSELTFTAAGTQELWYFGVHVNLNGEDWYSPVTPKDGQEDFYTWEESQEYAVMGLSDGDGSDTFLLTIPEEYAGGTASV